MNVMHARLFRPWFSCRSFDAFPAYFDTVFTLRGVGFFVETNWQGGAHWTFSISAVRFFSLRFQAGCCTGWIDFKEDSMTALYFVSGLVVLGLLVYLMVALLKPEWF